MSSDKHHHRRERRSLSPRERVHRQQDSRRTRSPGHDRARTHHSKEQDNPVRLPFNQASLRKHDLDTYRNLFADYLDIQKQLDISELDNDEIKGRWKSFINKWNAGTLAQGWYDPVRLVKAKDRYAGLEAHRQPAQRDEQPQHADASDEDEYGPGVPSSRLTTAGVPTRGPTIPKLQDLQYKRELEDEYREAVAEQIRDDRKLGRQAQKERLDELAPRADPGSRERQREKKQDISMTNRAYADAKDSGALEVADSELMGDDGVDAYRAKMKAKERQKNERELRREETLRARAAEREERLAEHRRKEEKTMETLRALAKQRFG